MTPDDPNEFELSLFGMRIRARGLVPVLAALAIALAIVFKTDLPDMREWVRLASR